MKIDFSELDNLIATGPKAWSGVSDIGRQLTAGNNYDFGLPTGKGQSAAGGDPWWMNALNAVSAPGKVVTNQLANWTDGSLNWRDIPLAAPVATVAQNQWKNWTDGAFKANDFTPWGMLGSAATAVGKQGAGFDQTLANLGAGAGVQRWGGLAGDIVLDPLNFLTLGGSSALKVGKAAMQAAAKDLAVEAGLKAGLKSDAVPMAIFDNVVNKYAGSGINPNLVDRLASKKYDEALEAITGAGKSASAKAQNALINFDIPFTNITKQFGQKGDLLKIQDGKIGTYGATAVDNLLQEAGLLDQADKTKYLKQVYGVDKAEDLSTQALKHLQDTVSAAGNKFVDNSGNAKAFLNDFDIQERMAQIFRPTGGRTVEYSKFDPEAFLKGLDPRIADRIAPLVTGMADNVTDINRAAPQAVDMLGDFIGKLPGTIKGKTADAVKAGLNDAAEGLRNADNTARIKHDPFAMTEELLRKVEAKPFTVDSLNNLLRQTDTFTQGAGGTSKLGSKIKNPFNARTANSADALVNQAANKTRDAETKIFGQTRQMERELGRIAKAAKGLSEDELKLIPKVIENAFEAGKTKADALKGKDSGKIEKVAGMVREHLTRIGKEDQAAGLVEELRQNYFPHMMKPNVDAILKKYEDDPELAELVGRSAANASNKQRKSFENLAQADNYVIELEQKAEAARIAGDTETAEKLAEKAADVMNLFERDPMKALGQRAYRSIRSKAMKELYDGFKKDGLMAIGKSDEATVKASYGLKQLDDAEIRSLGLDLKPGEKAWLHPEVLDGMKKVRNILNVKGTEKILGHLTTAVNIWKTLVTTAVPAHYVNNFIGNVANNAMAGVKPEAYREAGAILNKLRTGTANADEKRLIQELYDKGVIGQGFSSDFMRSPFSEAQTKLEKVERGIQNFKPVKKMREVGDAFDDFTRAALYIHGRNLTGSADKAGEMVRKYLFNYHEQTTADRMMRAAMPFWNWTKNNLPLQLHNLLVQPRYAITYLKVRDALQGETDPETLPQWIRDAYLKVPGTDSTYINPRLPLSDLNMIGSPMHMLNQMGAMLNPLAKAPIEVATNYQFFNQKPIDYDRNRTGEYDNGKLLDYMLNQSGIVGKTAKVFDSEDGVFNMDNLAALLVPKPVTVE